MSTKGYVKGEAVQIKNLQSVASESLNRHGSLKTKGEDYENRTDSSYQYVEI